MPLEMVLKSMSITHRGSPQRVSIAGLFYGVPAMPPPLLEAPSWLIAAGALLNYSQAKSANRIHTFLPKAGQRFGEN